MAQEQQISELPSGWVYVGGFPIKTACGETQKLTAENVLDICPTALEAAGLPMPEGATVVVNQHITFCFKTRKPSQEQHDAIGTEIVFKGDAVIARKDGTLAALRIIDCPVPCNNDFVHITLYTGGTAKPFDSNKLLEESTTGVAVVHKFKEPLTLVGRVGVFPFEE